MNRSIKQVQWELLVLAEKVQDGTLSAEEKERLQSLLKQPEHLEFYARQSLMSSRLRYEAARLNTPEMEDEMDPLPELRPRSKRPSIGLAMALCAVFLVVGMLLNMWLASLRPTTQSVGSLQVATLQEVRHAKWAGSSLPTVEGARIAAGTLELVEGMATLVFDSGAKVVMEAPSRLHIVDAMNCRLERGTLFADVPPSAIGFTVDTPEAKVVDYGTKFGVSASEDGHYLVKVIEGLVEVNPKASKEVKSLKAGQGVDTGVRRRQVAAHLPTELESSKWQPHISNEERDGWQILSTAYGVGKDTYLQNNGKGENFGKSPFFRVKYTNHATNLTRLGVLTFDLSKCDKDPIYDAELALSIEPSDLGFASMVPDSTFSIYGVVDESADTWDEERLSWESSAIPFPAQVDSQILASMPQLKFLGTFSVPQGANSGTRSVRSEALVEFLRQDTNKLVTFIVHRDTNDVGRDGLVHAFATKENPRSTPPLLRIKKQAD